jgi:hypothetical protein
MGTLRNCKQIAKAMLIFRISVAVQYPHCMVGEHERKGGGE